MIKKLLSKCFITFGLFLFFTSLLPFVPMNVNTAKATINTVVDKDNDYKLNVKSKTLVKGQTYTLKVYNVNENAKVIYKSDDTEVASVNNNGEISANKVGTTIITATVKVGGVTTTLPCEVTVGLPAFSVKLTRSRIILGIDKTDLLTAVLKPSNTVESARFSSYDSSIASVSIGGRLTARKAGFTYVFAEIDATNDDGTRRFSSCTVIVTSQADAPVLEDYFNNHAEDLNLISEEDLNKALYDYFNEKYDPNSSTSLESSLNSYLNDKFDFAKLHGVKGVDSAKIQSNSIEANSGN